MFFQKCGDVPKKTKDIVAVWAFFFVKRDKIGGDTRFLGAVDSPGDTFMGEPLFMNELQNRFDSP